MKKIIFSLALVLSIVFLNSCLKDKEFDSNQYGLKAAEINKTPIVQFLSGGLEKFSNQLIVPDASKSRDTAYFQVFYVNNGLPAAQDVTVKFAISPAALSAFNADPSRADFERQPDSTFIFTATSTVVKAGQSLSAPIPFIYFPNKIDASRLYMLAVAITDGGAGNIVSSNSSIYYIHIVGNPLAGEYKSNGFFYHPTAPRAISSLTKDLIAIDDIFCETTLGDLANPISIRIDGGNNVSVADLNGNVGIGPTTLYLVSTPYSPFPGSNPALYTNKYDPATKTFYLRYGYPGASGLRLVEEIMVKQ
jgi:hypothetical protein